MIDYQCFKCVGLNNSRRDESLSLRLYKFNALYVNYIGRFLQKLLRQYCGTFSLT